MKLQGKSLIDMGKIVNVIGEPHNLFRDKRVNIVGKHCSRELQYFLQPFPYKDYCISPSTVFSYYVYKFSLKILWGLPITFTSFPRTN